MREVQAAQNKEGGGGLNNNEEEKSKLELVEEEVKSSIFTVFYLVLKNQENSYWRFIVILLIEYLQLLSYTFDESVVDKWGDHSILTYFTQFLSTFRVVYWLQRLQWDVYIIIFYVCLFLVFVILIDFLYVSITFRMRKLSFQQPIQLLRIAVSMITTVALIPILELFFSISACGNRDVAQTTAAQDVANDQSTTTLNHVVFTEVVCFQSIHAVHAIMSYIVSLIYLVMIFLSVILGYENRFTKDPGSKINSKSDFYQAVQKVILVFFFTFFTQPQYALFKTLLLVFTSSFCFISYVYNRPFHNQTPQTLNELFSAIFAWANWVLLFTQVLTGTMFSGALEILFLGIPIICVIIHTKQEVRLKLLMTSERRIDTGDLCQLKNFYYLHIVDTREVRRESSIILKGYVNHHTEVCPYDTCPIKAYKRLMQKDKTISLIERKKKATKSLNKQVLTSDNNQLLMAQAKALYNNGIRKFPKHQGLRVDYAYFLHSRMRDRKTALAEAQKAESERPGLDHMFQIFRLRKLIEDELSEGHESGGADFMAAMNYESTFKQFKSCVEKSSMLHFEFWTHLQDDSPDLVRLSLQGAKINQSILAVEDSWKKLSHLSSNVPKALKLYASYQIDVLNDKESGNEQMMKAKEATNMRANFEMNGGVQGNQENDVNTYAQDGTPCIYISGESDRLGIITQCNLSVCKIFGYNKKDDILNKNVKMLQPSLYSDHHDDFLQESMEKSPDQISSRERQIFGKHVSGYVFPIWLQIKNIPSLLAGKQFVATFKVEKTGVNKTAGYLLFNNDREILDISPSCIQLLGLTTEQLHKRQIYFDGGSLLPDLFNGNQVNPLYLSKAGQTLRYYYPKLVDFNQEQQHQNQQQQIEDDSTTFRKKRQTHLFNGNPNMAGNGDEDETIMNNQELDENGELIGDEMLDDNGDNQDMSQYNKLSEQHTQMQLNQANKAKKNQKPGDELEDYEEEDTNKVKYLYRAVAAAQNQYQDFHANATELVFDLIHFKAGFFLRLELNAALTQSSQNAQNINARGLNKHLIQQAFQFSYDPIFKRFNRELRDTENKNHIVDRYYLDLKSKKELSLNEQAVQSDPNLTRYSAMSYINFLNRQQRMIERGDSEDNFDEEEENSQSEEDSNESGSQSQQIEEARKTKMVNSNARESTVNKNIGGLAPPGAGNFDFKGGEFNKMLIAADGYGKEFLRSEIERLIRVLQDKQSCGEGIHTFIRSENSRKGWEEDNNQKAGLFSDRGGDIDKVENDEEQEEQQTREQNDKSSDGDSLKANIKSKKAFSMAINDKNMPPAIKRLSQTAQVIVVGLIIIAIIEYAVMYSQFQDTSSNFSLIQKAYLRTAELQKVAYNVRSMILMKDGMLTNYAGYPSQAEYVSAIKTDFQNSLNLIYQIQNEINLNSLPLSDEHDQLLNNKTVTLYFKENIDSMRALQFSLTESILQISSTVFTISNMRVQDFTENNEDVFFMMYNSFNEFYLGLVKSSQLYVRELLDRASQKEEASTILFVISILALVAGFIVLIPVVASVNQQKDRVLSLFCEIDNGVLRILAAKCEKFINQIQREEGSDEIESNAEMEEGIPAEEEDDSYGLMSGSMRTKKAKGKTKTQKRFFLQVFLVLCCIHAYYLQNFILNTDTVDATLILTKELNVTAVTEPFYWFTLNNQREMIYNKDRVITLQSSLRVAIQSIYQMYDQQNDLQKMHLAQQDSLDTDYVDKYEKVMREDLCPQLDYFKNTTAQNCSKFISGTLNQGLHVVVVRYFQTLRNMLNLYQNYTAYNNITGIKSMIDLDSYYELYVVQNFVTQKLMRELVVSLEDSIQKELQFRIERKIAIFIVFVIVILFSFIVFWLPFLNGLNLQIYKTKLMLLIIPLEVLMKIKNVAKVLRSQNFIAQSQKKQSGSSSKRKAPEGN